MLTAMIRWGRRHEVTTKLLIAFGFAVLLAGAIWRQLPTIWWSVAGAWLLAVSVVAFVAYGFDKQRARNQGRRVPEVVLHALALAGGTLGAYLGMRVFRHKTLKGKFRIVFWTMAAVQFALAAVVVKAWLIG